MPTRNITANFPPGPKGHFLLGNLPEFMKDPLAFLTRCACDYGDVVCFWLGNTSVCLLNHPDYIEQVLLSPQDFQKSRLLRAFRSLFGKGLLTSEGVSWSNRRSTAQPFFLSGRIAGYSQIMRDCAEQKLSCWRDGEVLDLEKEMMELTLAIVLKALFHVDLDADIGEISAAVDWISRVSLGRIILNGQLPQPLVTPDKVRLKKFVRRLDKSIYEIIRRRRDSGNERDDFLGMLLRTNEEKWIGLTDRDIRDEVLTFILAGHGTTAVALTWTFYLLSLYIHAESKLTTELDTVLAGRAPNLQDLTALPSANQIMTESLRLYPPAWILTRDATRACELGGYGISPQTTILICPWVTQRDPRFFSNPEEFIPERWADGGPKKIHPYAYIPFGRGPRFCIGSSFAHIEVTFLLAIIAQRFRIRMPSEGRRPAPLGALTLRPKNGLRMVLDRK